MTKDRMDEITKKINMLKGEWDIKGEWVRSIAGRTRYDLVGDGDAICVYLTEDGALHSCHVSAGCFYISVPEEPIKIWYYDKPTKMETIRENAAKAYKEHLNRKYGRGSHEDFK